MSWTNELYQIYEKHFGKKDEKAMLLPVSHTTVNAQIEITLNENGELLDARRIVDKKESVTVIPVTEDSGSRSGSGTIPHPLMDKLIYIAGDYSQFVDGKKSDNRKYYQAYTNLLESWVESSFFHPAVKTVYKYIRKAAVIADLIKNDVLKLEETTGKIKQKEKILGIDQEDCFIRFRIEYEDLHKESCLWKDQTLYQSFIDFNASMSGEARLCYATGKVEPCTYKHPSKIRNAGDKAKLISSNDESGFSYRGRFNTKGQALSVSYDFSQKMHNALKWLIEKQGVSIGSMTMVIWESNLQKLPNVLQTSDQLWSEEDTSEEDTWEDLSEDDEMDMAPDTLPAYRSRLKKTIWGNTNKFDIRSKAMIMILDAATTGRLSISMYEEMEITRFYQNIEKWHTGIAWRRFDGKKKKSAIRTFSLYDIAECAYGTEQGGFISCKPEVKNETILRLIPCVIDGRAVPEDIIQNLVNKASKPSSYEKPYNWGRVLETTCGMIRKRSIESIEKKRREEEYNVSLQKEYAGRDYLYGRLLAIAEAVERSTYEKGNGRTTNAARYFEVFSNRPYQTWGIIYNRLMPYLNHMSPGLKTYYEKMIGQVMELFVPEEFRDNTKLKPEFLLAYHCQLNDIYNQKKGLEGEE